MQCVLVAYGEATMKAYRPALAHTLREAVKAPPKSLEEAGWNPGFVRECMAEAAAAAVMMDGGDSGDSVRIVTAAALLLWQGKDEKLDETQFWKRQNGDTRRGSFPAFTVLDPDTVIALTKLFVLEWSNEQDHRLYEDLPLEMLVV